MVNVSWNDARILPLAEPQGREDVRPRQPHVLGVVYVPRFINDFVDALNKCRQFDRDVMWVD